MAMMETWIFCPALSFMTMARYCTIDSIGDHAVNIVLAGAGVALAILLGSLLARFFAKRKSYEWGVYAYALAFANSGYMGDPIVLALFGDMALSYYKLYSLPLSLLIYSWGIGVMMPGRGKKGDFWLRMINAPTIAMLLGVAVGLSGLGKYLPVFFTGSLDTLKACMGPVAMLLAGATIAQYHFSSMLKNGKVYLASALRLIVIPAVIISFIYALKTLANSLFDLSIDNTVLFLAFFATATPMGLNTVIFPQAYGGNPETGAGMTMISHTLCVVTLPLLYAVMVMLFGVPFQ